MNRSDVTPSADDLDTIERIVHDLKQDSAASKRKRHALSMAKGRTRQREMLASLRAQRAHLQSVLQRALVDRMRIKHIENTRDLKALYLCSLSYNDCAVVPGYPQSPNSVLGGSEDVAATDSSAATTECFQEYVAAVKLQSAIHDEIESLQKRIEQYEIFEAALMIDTSMLLADPSSAAAEDTLRRASPVKSESSRGFWTQFMDGEEPFFFEPYDPSVAYELMRAMYTDSKQFNALFAKHQVSPSLENCCLGWNVQRSLKDKHHLRFHFLKRVPCASSASTATEILNETWRTFHSPELYARLYRTAMVSRVIQQVDASTSIILRNSPSKNRTLNVRMVTMVSKLVDRDAQGRRAHSVLTLVLDPPESALRFPNVMFIREAYTYLTFTEIEDDGVHGPMVEITYGGRGDCLNEAHATHLLIETGAALVRWEQFVCPQRLVTAQ